MKWKTALCLTITIATAVSVHITIENDLLINNNLDAPELENGTASSTETDGDQQTAATTASETTGTVADTTNTLTTPGYSTTSTTTPVYTTTAPTDTTESLEDDDGGSEEAMTEVPDNPDITTKRPEDENGSDEVQSSRSVEDGDRENFVLTTKGPVQGFEWNLNSGIIAYIDVPYGKFEGYFQESSQPEPWENIHDVKEHNKRCPQLQDDTYVGDLDCLTLSVFTPTNAERAGVLFYIHESNFVEGSGDPTVYGPEYFAKKGVIVILPNYRLGPLGFLCLRNATAPGNAALKDLTLALNWTKENIAAFGGDPSNIVVSGDGTSGALAGYLALSPMSKHYISKVITESGAVLSHWALDRNPSATMERLILKIRDLTFYNNTYETADIETIITAAKNVTIRPCTEHNDHPFLSNTPWELLYRSAINITFMIGSASHAGTREALSVSESSVEQLNQDFGVFLPNDLRFQNSELKADVGSRIRTQYFGEETISINHIEEMALCYTDSWYLGPAIRTARALVYAGATVYFYEFAFVGGLNRELESMHRPVNGSVRGDIVGYLFTQNGELPAENPEDKRMVTTMLNLWVTFIETGHPKIDNVEWNELQITTDTQEQWLSIGTNIELRRGLHINRMQLWTEIYNDYFIEHYHNFSLRLLPNVYTTVIPFLLWFGVWKMHTFEHTIK